jgi:hypothetical protein
LCAELESIDFAKPQEEPNPALRTKRRRVSVKNIPSPLRYAVETSSTNARVFPATHRFLFPPKRPPSSSCSPSLPRVLSRQHGQHEGRQLDPSDRRGTHVVVVVVVESTAHETPPFTLHPSHTQLITSIVAFACVAKYDWYSSKVQYMLFTVGIDLD